MKLIEITYEYFESKRRIKNKEKRPNIRINKFAFP